jgi:hypothetical protein
MPCFFLRELRLTEQIVPGGFNALTVPGLF